MATYKEGTPSAAIEETKLALLEKVKAMIGDVSTEEDMRQLAEAYAWIVRPDAGHGPA